MIPALKWELLEQQQKIQYEQQLESTARTVEQNSESYLIEEGSVVTRQASTFHNGGVEASITLELVTKKDFIRQKTQEI